MSKKTHFIGLRVSEEEYSSLMEFAESLGKDVPFSNVGISSAVRYCITTQLCEFHLRQKRDRLEV